MTVPSDLVAAIDHYWEENAEGHRSHLGASQIGKQCERMLVYSFRHATTASPKGRMLRLWRRGHLEEPRFFQYLRQVGFDVEEFAPDGRQWRFKTHGGHFAGSTDGRGTPRVRAFEGLPIDEPCLLECKTHNTKSFTHLLECAEKAQPGESAVRRSKPEHYDQMQTYMHHMELPRALYLAVNKNDDDLYSEVVPYHRQTAEALLAKAARVIAARQLPRRISDSPSWFACKYCDHLRVCHYGERLEKKCRTCRHCVAVDDARFHCGRWNTLIPLEIESKGCDSWETITD